MIQAADNHEITRTTQKPQKFKEDSKVWIKAEHAEPNATGSVLLTVVSVYRDPTTSSLSYKLEDGRGNVYKDGRAIPEKHLKAAGSGSK